MANKWLTAANDARDIFESQLTAIADRRVSAALREWARVYPTRSVSIIFGMGSESIMISGRRAAVSEGMLYIAPRSAPSSDPSVEFRGTAARAFASAIEDTREICGQYADACPSAAQTPARPVFRTLSVRCPVCGAHVGHACGCDYRFVGQLAEDHTCPEQRAHVGRARHARLEARLIRRRMGAQLMPAKRAQLRNAYEIAR